MSARNAERFGSYSSRTTSATPSLRRLKSIVRSRRLWPPPRWNTVMRPRLLRPPVSRLPSVSAFTGPPDHSSLRSTSTNWRRPGLVGLNVFNVIALDSCGHVDLGAFGQGHDRLFVIGALAGTAAEALGLAFDEDCVDRRDLHVEEPFDGDLHCPLIGIDRHAERHLIVLGRHRRLFGDHWR